VLINRSSDTVKKIVIAVLLLMAVFLFYQRTHPIPDKKTLSTPLYSSDTAKINALAKKANDYAMVGQLDEAMRFAQMVHSFSIKTGYMKGLCMSLTTEGRVLYRRAKYDSSLFILNKALMIAKALNDSSLQSASLLNLGNAYSYMGNHTFAIEYFFKGLAIEEKLRTKEYLQWYFNNIGVVFATQKNYPKGLEYFLKSKNVAESRANSKSVDLLYNNIGWVYMLLDKKDSALIFLKQSLLLSQKSKDKYTLTLCLHNLGELYVKLKQYDKAYLYCSRSYEISKQQGYRDQMVANLLTLGSMQLEQKNYDAAENYLLQGITLAKLIQAKIMIKDVSLLIATLYEKQKSYEKAYDYYEMYTNMKDTVLNQENSKRITEMNTKYNTEQKGKEIELMKKNEEIQHLELTKKGDELNQQRSISFSIFIGFLLLMVAAILVYNQYILNKKTNYKLQKAYTLIAEKNALIEKSNAIITDSIAYAKNLQDAILPDSEDLTRILSDEFFVLHRPSHIVSGDFYWCSSQESKTILVIADCTGHGVPGAFMSMIGNALLNEIVNERQVMAPEKIAELLDKRIIHVLHQYKGSQQYDGMDISICCIDKAKKEIIFTGARHAMYAFNGRLKKIKGDPYSIGGAQHQGTKQFTSQTVAYEKGLHLYFFTDGYCDQSGGADNKRFTSRQFETLLAQIQHIAMNDQKEKLEDAFENWKGDTKQRDDVLVIGVKC
jgi:serine phosphatase RsbU (regulator of sigma subunit)